MMYDTQTGFALGDCERNPLSHETADLPSRAELDAAAKPLILSASGWRKVFAASGDEEDATPSPGTANLVLAALMADVFADYLLAATGARSPRVFVGIDTRPTGPALADVLCRVFLARGLEVSYLFIAAAPEIMTAARGADGFAYVSASHNPIGHNGLKFGRNDGGVLSGAEIAPLIDSYKSAVAAPDAVAKACSLVSVAKPDQLRAVYAAVSQAKANALAAYAAFTRVVVSGVGDSAQATAFFSELRAQAERLEKAGKPISIVADFNGSARTVSIDRGIFAETGISLAAMNGAPRQIAHRIVPEGESLAPCAREIERLRRTGATAAERNAALGYVPDCDGDRGNIVFWNERKGVAEPLEAQEVFALSVIAELAHLEYIGAIDRQSDGRSSAPVAIAVNDPTSLRVEEILAAFGGTVFRAEVGEANVVNLAREKREAGYVVRILGEGSNGGNITWPSAVRDPIDTVFALLKLLVIRDEGGKDGLFHIWCKRSGQTAKYRDDFTLADVIDTLPQFVTTSVFESDAMLRIRAADHASLKRRFQSVFLREWESRKADLSARFGFNSWVAIANNGTKQTGGLVDFGVSGKGGLKVQFLDNAGKAAGYLWMRGSGTEPVFRILADARGGERWRERELLAWLTAMVLEADGEIL